MSAVRGWFAGVALAAVFGARAVEPDAGPAIVLKTVPARHYLYTRHPIASIDEVTRIEWAFGPKIVKQARALGVEQAGGVEYHVILRVPMHVDVALPVVRIPSDGDQALFKTTLPFECLALVHTGSPLELAEPWARLQRAVTQRGYTASGETRELIVSREGFDASRHVTELQAGIQRSDAASEPAEPRGGR
ncbi:MAG: hypothetical protein AMXMBFR59_22600 [Rhodanobacteraceae bacterium]